MSRDVNILFTCPQIMKALKELILLFIYCMAIQETSPAGAVRGKYCMLLSCGLLVTYSSKGAVRRSLQSAGFSVEKLKGLQVKEKW